MDAGAYFALAEEAMRADGCAVSWEVVASRPALVGYRVAFHKPTLSRLHIVSVVSAFEPAAGELASFTKDVSRFSKSHAQSLRGVQSGVMAFAVACSENPSEKAKGEAEAKPRVEFAVRVQPGLVDLAAGKIHTFQGTMVLGAVYNGFLRRTFEAQIPQPV